MVVPKYLRSNLAFYSWLSMQLQGYIADPNSFLSSTFNFACVLIMSLGYRVIFRFEPIMATSVFMAL
jgi:hypothetical protein